MIAGMRACSCEAIRDDAMQQAWNCVQSLAQRIHRNDEQQRSQYKPSWHSARELGFFRRSVMEYYPCRSSLKEPCDSRHQLRFHPKDSRCSDYVPVFYRVQCPCIVIETSWRPLFISLPLHALDTCISVSIIDAVGFKRTCFGYNLLAMQSRSSRTNTRSVSSRSV
ncbi:unnamed protein product [Trypanosoma congolense IL3000]|uniref:WGS project CAEQ00000000 data, annotated contig 1281 n=1 Tax=Trypanosoma congolense (strain IL3000) TaxID=1068625 RepID=F9W566_TRYCI|nr:unnamed protein product [Trypanosoma congolense IL3000]